MSRTLSEIIKAYSLGDHLTDGEMVRLRDLYHDVTIAVIPFGARYELVFMDAITQENKLNGFLMARGITTTDKEKEARRVYDNA
jgi:hypothetical protein